MGLMKGCRVENIGGIVKELLKLRGKGNNFDYDMDFIHEPLSEM